MKQCIVLPQSRIAFGKEVYSMLKFGKSVVKCRFLILIAAFALLVPSAISFVNTRINYDILSYLPSDIETMEGQDIMVKEFGSGAISFLILENMDYGEAEALDEEIRQLDGVKDTIWYGTVANPGIPRDFLPEDLYEMFNNKEADSQLMAVIFKDTMGSDQTMNAIDKMNKMAEGRCFVSGMGAVNTDTKNTIMEQIPVYVLIAVVLCFLVMAFTMDSVLAPVLFLLSIGMAIIYNLGTNFMQGEISYLTLALTAVLQLAVTLDYSIFLWHSYQEQTERFNGDKKRAMAHAISQTFVSVAGSSVTTVAGFLALCFMTFTLGLDLGIVMAKGVVIGVISCVTILPSMILVCDKAIEKTRHKVLAPDFSKLCQRITKHYRWIAVVFIVILIPAVYGYTNTSVYYDLASKMPDSTLSKQANDVLKKQYNMGATHIILAPGDMSSKDSRNMMQEIEHVDGVKMTLSLTSVFGPAIPEDFIPDDVKNIFQNGDYQMMLISSEYDTASDEVNAQIDEINHIIDRYSKDAMLIGEAPCTKDLITITDEDFKRVSAVSIAAIFVIIFVVFKSLSLPVILLAVIEFAIFVNMGLTTYTGTIIPFIASIVIGTIQLGATVDYAILMTNKYKRNRFEGMEKQGAVAKALETSIMSIIVSALCFFAATYGVGAYSDIDMVSQLCSLLSRGAIISMFAVILVLPAMFMIFDRVILSTSVGFRKNRTERQKERKARRI